MPNIIVASYPLAENYSAAFQIADRLKKWGYNLVFIDISDVFESQVVARGFEFEVILGDPSLSPHLMDKDNSLLVRVQRLFRSVKRSNVAHYVNAYDVLIEKFKPVVIVLDSRLIENTLLLSKYNIQTLVFQNLICPNKLPGVPPPNSRFIPRHSLWSHLMTEYLWLRFFVMKTRDRIQDNMHDRNQGLVRYAVLKELATLIDYPVKEYIERRRFLNIGIRNVPEFIVHPRELDFPHKEPVNQFYIGYPSGESDVAPSSHSDITKYIGSIRSGSDRPLVGCILGNSGDIQLKTYKRDWTKMFEAFKIKSECDFVIFLGNDIEPDSLGICPANIHFVHYLELSLTADITEYFDLLMTHADMNAITNAVHAGVPMLIFPRYNGNDQNGNAARVVYHGLGVQGKLGADSVAKIIERIDHVLGNPLYKSRVLKMKQRIQDSPHALNSNKVLGYFMEAADKSFLRRVGEVMCDAIS